MFVLFGFVCLFCDLIGFYNNLFEKKTTEKARKKKAKEYSIFKRFVLLPGYPLLRRICHMCILVIVLCDLVIQVPLWIFPQIQETVFGIIILWINLAAFFFAYGFASVQSFIYSFKERQTIWGKCIDILGGLFCSFAILMALLLLGYLLFTELGGSF